MCKGLQLLIDDAVNRGMQSVYDILNELIAGPPEAEICTKLGVTMRDVKRAKAVFDRIRNPKSVPVSL